MSRPLFFVLGLLFGAAAASAAAAAWEPAPAFPAGIATRGYVAAVSHEGRLMALGGTPFDAADNAPVHYLDSGAAEWATGPALEGAVVHVGAAVDGAGRIIVLGGIDVLNGDTGNNYVYDLVEGPWDGLPDRLAGAADTLFATAVDAAGRVYTLGGGRGAAGQNTDDVQRYDPASDTWQAVAPLPTAVADAAACRDAGGRLLLIGGFTAGGTTRSAAVPVFDPATGAWSTDLVPDLPAGRTGHRAVRGADDRIYVIGGVVGPADAGTTTANVLVLDAAGIAWSDGPSLAEARRHFGATLHDDDHIYVLGGLNAAGGTATCERLDTPVCPTFTAQPASAQPWLGQTFILAAGVAGGEPLAYRWRREGADLADGPAPGGGEISGADSPTLTITAIGEADAGVYDLVATNPCGDAASEPATVAVRTPPPMPPTWTTASVHPAGAAASRALAVEGAMVVGYATVAGADGDEEHAWQWDLAAATSTDLHPGQESPTSHANGIAGTTAVGYWWHPYDVNHNGQWYTIHLPKACRWLGGPAGWEEIIMGGQYEYTSLEAVDASGAVGTASWDDGSGNHYSRAFWIPTGGGVSFLHPASGVSNSFCSAIDEGRQFGHINTPYPGPVSHAAMWSGDAASFVDLHPAGASRSWIEAADDGQQIGKAEFDGVLTSLLWSGSREGLVALGASGGSASGVGGGLQVGSVGAGGVAHACVWRGTPDSMVDLHGWLPSVYDSSTALDVDVAADGTIRIVGHAHRSDLGRTEAVVWSSEPAAVGVDDHGAVIAGAGLSLRAWPNPLARAGTIAFELPRGGEVTLELFDVRGRRVREILGTGLAAGPHVVRWDRRQEGGERLAAGTYLLRLRTGGAVQTRKVLLLE